MQAGPLSEVEWSRTPEAFVGKNMIVQLSGGTRIEGSWLSVEPTSFRMNVTKTNNPKAAPKGFQTLQRASLGTVRMRTHRVRGRLIGTAVGMIGIGNLGAAASGSFDGAVIGLLTGSVAGYFTGRLWDHRSVLVTIVPDRP